MPIVTKVIQLKDIQGNLLLPHAFSASKDNEGNDIINTYATIATVNTKANDNAVVHNTGVETIAGAKTFSTTPIVGTLAQTSSSDAAASTSYVRTAISDEDALVVHLTGDEEISGIKTFTSAPVSISMSSDSKATYLDSYKIVDPNLDTTVNPEYRKEYYDCVKDKNDNYIGWICYEYATDGSSIVSINSRTRDSENTTNLSAYVKAYVDRSGTTYATCPTPPSATDNSTKIATTSWVRNHRCTTNATTSSTASVDAPAYVVQNYKSGSNWYRVWSDGWIEQGGSRGGIATDNYITITFHKAFKDTNYCFVETTKANGAPGGNIRSSAMIYSMTNTTIQLEQDTYADSGGCWYACGY